MFAYRRKRSLGCEQLEGRFAPSSVLVGGGGRSTLRDAQALETAQAEQAASYLAASAVLSQSSSVANVAPISDVQRLDFSKMPVFTMYQMPDGRIHCMGGSTRPMHREGSVGLPQSTGDGTASDGKVIGDNGHATDIPSSKSDSTLNQATIPFKLLSTEPPEGVPVARAITMPMFVMYCNPDGTYQCKDGPLSTGYELDIKWGAQV